MSFLYLSTENKKHHDKGPEETELLISGQKKREDLDEEKMDMTETDCVSVLTEKKNKLEHKRHKLMSQIERLETERTENKKKLQSFWHINKDNLLHMRWEMDSKMKEYEKSLHRIEGGIETAEDFITIITEMMKKVEKEEMSEKPEDTNRPRDEIQSDQSEIKEETDRNTDVSTTADTTQPACL